MVVCPESGHRLNIPTDRRSSRVTESSWIGAAFTAADAFYAPVAFRIRTYGLDVGDGRAWVEHVLAHPAMREWEAEALAESWREESHEAELAQAGTVTADYRRR